MKHTVKVSPGLTIVALIAVAVAPTIHTQEAGGADSHVAKRRRQAKPARQGIPRFGACFRHDWNSPVSAPASAPACRDVVR